MYEPVAIPTRLPQAPEPELFEPSYLGDWGDEAIEEGLEV